MAVQCVIDVSTMVLPTNASNDVWTEDDDEDDRVAVGLSNLGNTCYQNAIIQCLVHNKAFISRLKQQSIEENSIADHLLRVIRVNRSESVIGCEGIRDSMARRHSWLGDGRQHDAQEFLVLLLDCLHDQLKQHKRLKGDDNDLEEEESREWRRSQQLSGTSVVSETFSGQLCSQVTCLHCEQTSRSFEPFMYLCVPVPVCLEVSLRITWCPLEGQRSEHVIKVENKYDSIVVLKRLMSHVTNIDDNDELLLAEVDDSHVRRLLNDSEDVLSVVSSRSLHLFALNPCNPNTNSTCIRTCPICLEHFPQEQLMAHALCQSAVCVTCLSQLEHYGRATETGKRFSCHACAQELSSDDFSPEKSQFFVIPLLFRSHARLMHSVHVLRVSAQMDASELYALVDQRVPFPEFTYKVVFVERDGSGCCRCSWGSTCSGCQVSRDSSISLMPSDTLCVDFEEKPEKTETETQVKEEHPIETKEIHLNDCFRAFSASETSEWFCSNCQQLRIGKKSLRVTRAPNTLIVSLKRFHFFGNKSHKIQEIVRIPDSLDQTLIDCCYDNNKYKLRALVLHSGSTVSSGHYSAFVWDDNKWLLCNDDTVSAEEPSENDSRAYILFYSLQEVTIDAILSTIESSI